MKFVFIVMLVATVYQDGNISHTEYTALGNYGDNLDRCIDDAYFYKENYVARRDYGEGDYRVFEYDCTVYPSQE